VSKPQYTLGEIAHHLGATVKYKDESASTASLNRVISGIATLTSAKEDEISFLSNSKYEKFLSNTRAAAVILAPEQVPYCLVDALVLSDPYLGYAKAAQLFDLAPSPSPGIHPTAVIGEDCHVADTASIGAYVVLGRGVSVGERTVIHPHVVLSDHVSIGNDCILYPQVSLYHHVSLGNGVIIHGGAVIGADGFGMARNEKGEWIKIPQLGTVEIQDQVEIGANTTIDRGALENTIIEKGVKLDNQIQIGHNVVLGENTAIAACTGISGSTKIGKNCMISGMVGFAGHLEIADGTIITGMTKVTKSIKKRGVYSSGTGIEPHETWLKNAVRFRQLEDMMQRLASLEKTKDELTK